MHQRQTQKKTNRELQKFIRGNNNKGNLDEVVHKFFKLFFSPARLQNAVLPCLI
jgi:hypothetical protein